MALRVSYWGVNKTLFFRRDVMSHFTAFKATGPGAKLALVAFAAASALGFGTAGAADIDSDAPSVVVKYSEQSLSTDSGVKRLYAQIVRASKQVCPSAPESIRDLRLQTLVKECQDQAIARAIAKVDNAQLAALYAAHSKNG
jgi:UrcA family protein